MLKKLLKYNLIDSYKFLSIFYILSIGGAILTRLIGLINNSLIFDIVGKIVSGFTIAMIVNILINNMIRLWVRFKDTMYKDESYLTHTLPINRNTLYLSKFLNSLITLFTSVVVIIITLFIAYYSKETLDMLRSVLEGVANVFDTPLVMFVLCMLLLLFLEILLGINVGFTGIILGNKMDDKKTLFSIVFGFITYNIYQIMLLVVFFIFALFNKNIMNLFISNTLIDFDTLKFLVLLSIIFYSLLIIINYFVGNKLLKKGVNVD